MKEHIISGKIWTGSHEEGHTALFIGYNSDPFARRFDEVVCGKLAAVKYWIDDKELSKEQLKEETLKSISGAISANYYHRYSEYTGYLWTEENAKVGGHDILNELRGHVGKYLYMEIKAQ